MSAMLASVNSLKEALFMQSFNADVIDLKQPAKGALGALAVEDVAEIVKSLESGRVISATVGDLPMQPDVLYQAVQAMAATGVDYVKIGFFPADNWQDCIQRLGFLAKQGHRLIAVLFADAQPDLMIIQALQEAGFAGVMLDTMHKNTGSLTQLMSQTELQTFVCTAKAAGLISGLAGSLTKDDISVLLPLRADYLGFRGALCKQSQRTAALDSEQIADIRQRIMVDKQ